MNKSSELTQIPVYAFYNCSSLSNTGNWKEVTNIGSNAFYGCKSLQTFNLYYGLTSIDEHAFDYCGLTTVILPETVSNIGEYCFGNCDSLTSIDISLSQITVLPDGFVNNCSLLTNVNFNSKITKIGANAFQSCGFKNINVPASVETLGNSALATCKQLENVTGCANVSVIGSNCFKGNVNLNKIEGCFKVTKLEMYVFDNCTKLRELSLDWSKLTDIGYRSFGSCSSLEGEITLYNCNVDSAAFYGCPLKVNLVITK